MLRRCTVSLVCSAVMAVTAANTPAAEHKELKAFPPAGDGMVRFVIVLPHKDRGEEGDLKVELIAGKQMETDGVNLYRLGSNINPQPLVGWGYTFYKVKGDGPAMSTMMAAPPGTPKETKFVGGQPLQIRYNSRLPVVIYAPKGYDIRYRIWRASDAFTPVDKG